MSVNPRLARDPIEEEPSQLLTAIRGYEKEPLVSLKEACESLRTILDDLDHYVHIAITNSQQPVDNLTPDESASIHLYTIEWEVSDQSLYAVLNRTLRKPKRNLLKPWLKYLRLLITALLRLPETQGTLWRGVRGDLSHQYLPSTKKVWWAFSSCTGDLSVLQRPSFVGQSGTRTLFCIDESTGGRNISCHSHYKSEAEILLLPGTHLEVQSCLRRNDGLHIIHLKQVPSPIELLVLPNMTRVVSARNNMLSNQTQILTKSVGRAIHFDTDDDDDDDDDDGSSSLIQSSSSFSKSSQMKPSGPHAIRDSVTAFKSHGNEGHARKFLVENRFIGFIRISYADRIGDYIMIENVSHMDQSIGEWSLRRTNHEPMEKLYYEFPAGFTINARSSLRILSRNGRKKRAKTAHSLDNNSIVADYICSWGTGCDMKNQLFDNIGNEQAIYIQKRTP